MNLAGWFDDVNKACMDFSVCAFGMLVFIGGRVGYSGLHGLWFGFGGGALIFSGLV
jgi:hypothetical protein